MKLRLLFPVAGAFLIHGAIASAQSASRHTITHEDIFLMKRVSGPVPSPDGRLTVFSVTEPSYVEANQVSDLWIVPTDGSSAPRRLTNSKGGESGVEWSPDGRKIAFSARREDDSTAQIYVMSIADGGEATRVTNVSTGASAPHWRPDGRAILFSSMIYPGALTDSANRLAAAEHRSRKYNARVFESSPIRIWDHWLDDRKPSLWIQSLDPVAPARDILTGSKLAAGGGFGGQLGNAGEGIAATWMPDGSGVVFAATANRNEWTYKDVVTALWFVPATGGEPRTITTDNSDYGSPKFSPNGKSLYATMQPTDSKTFHNARLVMWTLGQMASTPKVVAGGPDLSVGDFDFTPDKKSILFTAENQGYVKLYRAPANGGETREVGAMHGGAYGGVNVGGSTTPIVVTTWQSAVHPPEVGRIDLDTGKWIALSHFTDDRVAQINFQPLREFWFTNSRGERIHSFYALPPNFDSTKKYPVFVLIHGGAANMWTDNFGLRWNPHLLGSPGYVVLMTDYRGSTGYTEKFSQDIQFDPLKGPANDLNEAADEAIKRYPFIDRERQIAGGASYGGHLTNWLAVTTTRYRALVSHAGEWDLESQWATSDYNYDRERNIGGPPWDTLSLWRAQSPMRLAANLKTPVLVSVGERDYRVPMNNALEFWTALQRQRVPSKLIVWPTENHWILNGENSRFFYRQVQDWFARWLNAPPATRSGS
ncbi:MAG TPA: S9 family peptidase [Gemmatimonadaceae bacterium]|nr:S9 family peptidase [Gemmatimonadaceae bacterium]